MKTVKKQIYLNINLEEVTRDSGHSCFDIKSTRFKYSIGTNSYIENLETLEHFIEVEEPETLKEFLDVNEIKKKDLVKWLNINYKKNYENT